MTHDFINVVNKFLTYHIFQRFQEDS